MTRSTKQAFVIEGTSLTAKERRALRKQVAAAVRDSGETRTRVDVDLPPAGAPKIGPGIIEQGWWNPLAMAVPPHRATTNDLAAIYPFVADRGIGTRGPILGVDKNADALFCFSPWEAYNDSTERGTFSTNILVLGAYRAGKSGTVKCMVSRGLAWGYQAVVPSDSKGEWTALADNVGGLTIRLGGPAAPRLNPLDRGPMRQGIAESEDEAIVRQRRVTTLVQLLEMVSPSKTLTPAEHSVLVLALELAIETTNDRPTLRAVHHELGRIMKDQSLEVERKPREAAEDIRLLLNRFVTGDLSGLFEDESTVEFDEDAPIVVVDTSELFQRSELVAQIAQVCTTSWVQAVISDRNARRQRYLIREEGWRDMTSVQSLQMYQQWLKLSRHYGIANIVILHKMGDLDAVGPEGSQERSLAYSVVQDIENKFIFRVNHQEQRNLRDKLNLPETHVAIARQLQKGEFLGYVGKFAYVVDCFSTSTPEEFELFKTDDAMMGDRTVPESAAEPQPFSMDELWPVPETETNDVAGWLSAARETTGV
ncbi:MAG: hypothetical protein K0S70_340 [Microbacterium sp.]|jgi:hypothetical protein|nr:hypothetical protein [Microbacterium sp.]